MSFWKQDTPNPTEDCKNQSFSNSIIYTNRTADFRNIRTSGFTECRDGVDGRNALGEEGIGNYFGTFGIRKTRGWWLGYVP